MTTADMNVLIARIKTHITESRLAATPGQRCYHLRIINATARELADGAAAEASMLYREELRRKEAVE